MKTWISAHPDLFATFLLLGAIALIVIFKLIADAMSRRNTRIINPTPDVPQRTPNAQELLTLQPAYRYASILGNGTASMMGNGVNTGVAGARVNQGGAQVR